MFPVILNPVNIYYNIVISVCRSEIFLLLLILHSLGFLTAIHFQNYFFTSTVILCDFLQTNLPNQTTSRSWKCTKIPWCCHGNHQPATEAWTSQTTSSRNVTRRGTHGLMWRPLTALTVLIPFRNSWKAMSTSSVSRQRMKWVLGNQLNSLKAPLPRVHTVSWLRHVKCHQLYHPTPLFLPNRTNVPLWVLTVLSMCWKIWYFIYQIDACKWHYSVKAIKFYMQSWKH